MKKFYLKCQKSKILILFSFLVFCGPPKPELLPVEAEPPEPSVEQIREELKDKDPIVRGQAAATAMRYNKKELIPELLQILAKDSSENARTAAAIALAHFKEKKAAPHIVAMLKQKIGPADLLVEALAEVGSSADAMVLLPYLTVQDSTTRYKTAEALKKLKAYSAGKFVLEQAKKQKETEVILSHVLALGWLKYKPAESYLLELLKQNPRSSLAATCINALGDMGIHSAYKAILPYLRESDSWTLLRERAVEALRKIPTEELSQKLFEELESEHATASRLALSVLEEYPPSLVVPKARVLIEKDKKWRAKAAYLLGRKKDLASREKIEQVLVDKEVPERELVAMGLGYLQSKESIPVLRQVAQETEGKARYLAVWALGVMEAREALEDIRKALKSPDREMVAYALEALAAMPQEEDVPELRVHLFNDTGQPLLAASALARIPGEKALQVLLDGATSRKDVVRAAAYEGLSLRQDKKALPFLMERLEKSSAEERKLIIAALRNITGEKFDTVAKWLNWYRTQKP